MLGRTLVRIKFDGTSQQQYAMKKMVMSMEYWLGSIPRSLLMPAAFALP